MMYEEIKQNFIEHFFNVNYRYVVCMTKASVIGDIKKRCVFPFTYNEENNVLHMMLGDNVNIDFNFLWEARTNDVRNNTSYRLISIS